MTVEAKTDYHVEFAKAELTEGVQSEVKHRFIFTTKKAFSPPMQNGAPKQEQLTKGQELFNAIVNVPGIDMVQPVGRYSLEVIVAKTYDPEEVIEGIVEAIRPIQSDIITPRLVTP